MLPVISGAPSTKAPKVKPKVAPSRYWLAPAVKANRLTRIITGLLALAHVARSNYCEVSNSMTQGPDSPNKPFLGFGKEYSPDEIRKISEDISIFENNSPPPFLKSLSTILAQYNSFDANQFIETFRGREKHGFENLMFRVEAKQNKYCRITIHHADVYLPQMNTQGLSKSFQKLLKRFISLSENCSDHNSWKSRIRKLDIWVFAPEAPNAIQEYHQHNIDRVDPRLPEQRTTYGLSLSKDTTRSTHFLHEHNSSLRGARQTNSLAPTNEFFIFNGQHPHKGPPGINRETRVFFNYVLEVDPSLYNKQTPSLEL